MRQRTAQAMLWGSHSEVRACLGGALKRGNGQRVGIVKKGSTGEATRILKADGTWALNFGRYKYIKKKAGGHAKQTEQVPQEQRCSHCSEPSSVRSG